MKAKNHKKSSNTKEQRINNELKILPSYFDNKLLLKPVTDSEENNQVMNIGVEERCWKSEPILDSNEKMSQAHQKNQNNINSPSAQCMDSSFLLSTLLNKNNEIPKKVLDEIPKSQPKIDTENTLTAITTTNVSVEEYKAQRNNSALPSHSKNPYQLWSPFANYKKLVNQKVPLKFTPWKSMYLQMEEEVALLRSSIKYSDNCAECRKRKSEYDNSRVFKKHENTNYR